MTGLARRAVCHDILTGTAQIETQDEVSLWMRDGGRS